MSSDKAKKVREAAIQAIAEALQNADAAAGKIEANNHMPMYVSRAEYLLTIHDQLDERHAKVLTDTKAATKPIVL